MSWRRLTFLLVVCVTLDLSSPFVAGAFRFNPDESVDGVSAPSERIHRQPGTAAAPVPAAAEASGTRLASRARRLAGDAHVAWVVDLRLSHVPAPRPPSPTDDH